MNWEDECYLLSKRKFKENANIINIFTPKKGKIDGIVYGGNSRKIRNYLQISNKLFVIHSSKNENKIGYFKTELIKPISPLFFNNKERTSALISICSLLNILLPEGQPNIKIYNSFENLIDSINFENWIILYIVFELNLIKDLGYTYDVPLYLITKKIPEKINNNLIKKSLYFTRNIILNRFFLPNNIPFPRSRVILENYFN